jgi:hypothetical protein
MSALPVTSSGRGLLWLGILCAILGPPLYLAQLLIWGQTVSPWYLPVLATLGVGLVVLSLSCRRTAWRWLAFAFALLIAGGSWWFLTSYVRLPGYKGPVIADRSFPEFRVQRADGTAFSPIDPAGDRATALVFFRGHW